MANEIDPSGGASPGRDARYMSVALALARRGLGAVWPNPAVGCVLVRDGRVVGRGWTQPGGRPHAEAEALRRAGEAARGAVAYVGLEPCAHHGESPPCAEALIEAGVARVVVALEDPDRRVAGRGIARLRAADIVVTTGVKRAEAEVLNAGFLLRVNEGRPLVTLKLATTLDGRIATHGGESRWITSEAARARAHLLRAEHDAVMVGAETALADDPLLTCRLPGLARRSPVRIVLDGRLRLPPSHRVVATARELPTWVITGSDGETAAAKALIKAGVEIISLSAGESARPELGVALAALARRGVTRLLVEGGGRLAAALLRARLVDRLAWFRAPLLIGGDGVPAAAAFGVDRLADAPAFVRRSLAALGPDILESYAKPD